MPTRKNFTKPILCCIATLSIWEPLASGKAREEIAVGFDTEPRTIDPRFAVDANSQYLEDLLHCSLVDFDPDGAVIGELAESWNWKDPLTLTLNIKKDYKFADGKTVQPSDVVATYRFFQQPDLKRPTPRAAAYSTVENVSLGKNGEIVFKLKEPDASFLSNLVIGVLPEKIAKSDYIEDDDKVMGCGPFILKDRDPTSLVLNKNSFSPDQRIADRVVIKIVKDDSTRFAKLRNGELDLVQNAMSLDKVVDLEKKYPKLSVMRRPGRNTSYIGFNMKDPVLSNVNIRQAIAYGINRDAIIEYILRGFAVPAKSLLTEDDPYTPKNLPAFSYDPEKAKALLKEAGFSKSKPLELSYKTTTDRTRLAIAKAIASDLKKVGINLNVQSLEWGRFKSDVEKGNVQLWGLRWVGFKDPDMLRYAFATESFPPNGGNRGHFSNPKLDALLTEGRRTTDEAKRIKIYHDAQELISEQMPYVFLWHEEVLAVLNKDRMKGFEVYSDGRLSALHSPKKM